MKKIPTIFLIIIFLTPLALWSQSPKLVTNLQDINEERYPDIKGNPYLLKDWTKGTIEEAKGNQFDNQLIRYNGYTKGFEVKKGEQFAELDSKWYFKITLLPGGEAPLVFKRAVHEKFAHRFVQVLYEGEKIQLIKEPFKSVDDKTIQDYGKTLEIKQFMNRKNYYFLEGEKLSLIRLNKKKLYERLGHKKELEAFAKKNRLKIDNEKGLAKILSYWETL